MWGFDQHPGGSKGVLSKISPGILLNVGSQFGSSCYMSIPPLKSGVIVSWVCYRDKFPAQVALFEEGAFFVVSLQQCCMLSMMLNVKMRILWQHVPFLSQSWKWKFQSSSFRRNPVYTSMIMLWRAIRDFLDSSVSFGVLFAVMLWKIISLCQLKPSPWDFQNWDAIHQS